MLGLVFTFENDPEHDPVLVQRSASRRVGDALAVAVNAIEGIHVEEITAIDNDEPKFAVIFNELSLIDAFTARLTLAVTPAGLRINNVKAINDRNPLQQDAAA